MSVPDRLAERGGVATRANLLRVARRQDVDHALASGQILAAGRGRYVLPAVDEATRAAHGLNGILSHTSAALHHGWEISRAPDVPHVLVPRKRKIDPSRRRRALLHRADLHPDDIDGVATGVEATLAHCLRSLPYAEALAVADSALRHGVTPATLARVAASARGPGAPQIRRVASNARPEAANPFESVLRAITHAVPLLRARPQVRISTTRWVRPDLVDEDLRLVLEADSFAWHGGRAALRRDALRYNMLVVEGWTVLRFAWEDVMYHPDDVGNTLLAAVDLVQRRTNVGCPPRILG